MQLVSSQEQGGPESQQGPLQFGLDVLRGQAREFATLGGLFDSAKEDLDAPALAIDFAGFGLTQIQIVRHEKDGMLAVMQCDEFQDQRRLKATLGLVGPEIDITVAELEFAQIL